MIARSRSVLIACAVSVIVLSLVGCKGEDIVGLSMNDEIKLGKQSGDQFEQQYGRNRDANLNNLVTGIGSKIARLASPPDYPYDYRVLNNNQVNANAFPGGRIYIWTGLLSHLNDNPDQLAFVIGHETTHVAHQHTKKVIERAMGMDMVIQVLLGGKGAEQYASMVANLMLQGYGRDNEYEADKFGLRFAHDAGYDPTAAYAVIHEFQKLSGNKDPNSVELLFDTHPGNKDRLNALKAEIDRNGWSGNYRP